MKSDNRLGTSSRRDQITRHRRLPEVKTNQKAVVHDPLLLKKLTVPINLPVDDRNSTIIYQPDQKGNGFRLERSMKEMEDPYPVCCG